MFSDLSNSGELELLNARIEQVEEELRTLEVTTRQEALAAVYSRLNGVLALGNRVSPLRPVLKEGPAVAGDLDANFRILNRDAEAIVRQLLNTEDDAAKLFNLTTGYVRPKGLELLTLSPIGMREKILALIDAEIANAQEGKPSAVWAKLNSLVDGVVINKLYEASEAGVSIVLPCASRVSTRWFPVIWQVAATI